MMTKTEKALERIRAQVAESKEGLKESKKHDDISAMTDAELDREIARIESGVKDEPRTSKDDPRVMEVFNRMFEDILSAYGSRVNKERG